MPFPFQKKKSEKKSHRAGLTDPTVNQRSYNGAGGTPTQSPVPMRYNTPAANHAPVPPVASDATRGVHGDAMHPSPAQTAAEPKAGPQKLVFTAFLAHGSRAGKIEGFTNVKELYDKIGEAFHMPADEILFCTLNTYRVEMENLLGGQIGLHDKIYAHTKGQKYEIAVDKVEAALGLTITDNGAGHAFVKRIKEGSVMSKNEYVDIGDHIVMINNRDLVGCRHFEVAKALKDLPIGEEFTLKLIKPNTGFSEIAPRGSKTATPSSANIQTGRATLRLHSKGLAKVQSLPSDYEQAAINKVDDCLESYMGIRDLEMATSIVDMFKGKNDFLEFMTSFEENFGDFGFPEAFVFEVWGFIGDAKERRLQTSGPVANNTMVAEFDTQF